MKWNNIIALLLIIPLFMACQKPKSVKELIGEEVQVKIEKLKAKKRAECEEYIFSEAENYVDSIMYLEIGSTLETNFIIPERPNRSDDSIGYNVVLDTNGLGTKWVDTTEIK